MAVPKKKVSKSRRDMRRKDHAEKELSLKVCKSCGKKIKPHSTCKYCGTYSK